MSEFGLLGFGGRDYPHAALRTPRTAQHLHPCVRLCRLDQEGHGDGLTPLGMCRRQWWFDFQHTAKGPVLKNVKAEFKASIVTGWHVLYLVSLLLLYATPILTGSRLLML